MAHTGTGGATCSVHVEVGALVGDVPSGLESGALGGGLAGVPLGHAHVHLERALGDVQAGEQNGHLREPITSCVKHGNAWLLAGRGTGSHPPLLQLPTAQIIAPHTHTNSLRN